MPYYAIAKGVKPGIYNNWNTCKQYVLGYSGAIYKKFSTIDEAHNFIEEKAESVTIDSIKSTRSTAINYNKRMFSLNSSTKELDLSINFNETGPIKNFMSKLNFPINEYEKHPSKFLTGIKYSEIKDIKINKIYVDGASKGNGKILCPPSGYGIFYGLNDSRNSAVALVNIDNITENKPTNQRAELFAIKHALIDIANEIYLIKNSNKILNIKYEIYSDSQYAQKCLTEWVKVWYNNNWKVGNGKSVSNKDIISTLIPILNYINLIYNSNKLGDLQFYHVKGHLGNFGNEWADKLANYGADEMLNLLNAD